MPTTGWPASFNSSRVVKMRKASQGAFVGWLLHEDAFGEIHLAGDGLHLIVREAIAVGENGERVAFKARGGENVERVEAMFHWILSHGRSRHVDQMRSSVGTVLSL